MYYMIYAEDHEDSLSKRMQVRPDHIERLHILKEEGRLLIAGPNPILDTMEPNDAGFSGSLIVAEFESLEHAQQWAASDPYVHGKVYKKVTVKPFKKVLP